MLGLPQGYQPSRAAIDAAPAGAAPTFFSQTAGAILDNGFSAGTKTLSNLNGGANFPSGALVIVGVGQDQNGVSLSNPLIGGHAATLVSGTQDTNKNTQFYQAVMPSNSPDTFSFDNGNAANKIAAAACYMTGINSTTSDAAKRDFGSVAQPIALDATITVPSNGFGVAFVFATNVGLSGANTVTWSGTTNADGDANSGTTSTTQVSLAHTATAGSWNPTVVGDSVSFDFTAAIAATTWGP